jgi:oligogalacturonide lyase
MRPPIVAAFALVLLPLACIAQATPGGPMPPRSWVDKDTGHRVWRLSDEPNSGAFYFNINAYTPDNKQMVYSAPDGIHVLDLATRQARLLVANPPQPAAAPGAAAPQGPVPGTIHILVVGHKTNSVFYTSTDTNHIITIYKADTNTGAIHKLAVVPHLPNTSSWSVVSVNADETLIAGTYVEGDDTGKQYGSNLPAQPVGAAPGAAGNPDNRVGSAAQGPHYQPPNKSQMMVARLAARLPLVLFTLRLESGPNGAKPGDLKPLLHSTDWVNHLLFSPTDPSLLMYCHEGIWQDVDRIWMIHTDGTHNTLIHKRTMYMEIAGHEFWGPDGETIWYQWDYPRNADSSFVAGDNVKTGERFAYHTQRDDASIHVNVTKDLSLFAGDGGFPGQGALARDCAWIELFHPQLIRGESLALNSPDFWQPGVFHTEHLVNMSWHYYREEPNVRFSPDKKLVIFTSNMFGPSYVFGAEVEKAVDPPAADVVSTPELAKRFNPTGPPTGRPSVPPPATSTPPAR